MVAMAHRGFTLIEVLIALTIVFLVGLAVFQGYRTAMDASAKAAASVVHLANRQQAEGRIRTALKDGVTSGQWQTGDIWFEWQARLLDNPETVRCFDPESIRVETSGRRVSLYEVTMSFADRAVEQTQMLVPESNP